MDVVKQHVENRCYWNGYWSEKHIKAWQFISDAEIKGFCDRNKGLLFEKAAQFHIPTELG